MSFKNFVSRQKGKKRTETRLYDVRIAGSALFGITDTRDIRSKLSLLLKKVFIFKSQWSRNEYIRCCEIRATLVQTSRYPSTNSRVLLSCPRIGRSVVEEAEKGKKEEKADRTGATLSLTYRSNSLIKLPMNYSRVHAWKKKEMTWRIFGKFVKVESTV